MHGTTMIFLFAMPILIGFANYLVPLMIGARDMAFPRLNALSFWLFLFGGLMLYSGLLFGGVLDTGWFSYAPLTEKAFSPHDGVSIWIIALALLGISSVAGAINFIMTMLRLRAPGMSWRRMPHVLHRHLRQLVPHPVRLPQPHGGARPALPRPLPPAPAGTTRRAAATRSSGSTCSGSSAIPRSTSSSCRPSA